MTLRQAPARHVFVVIVVLASAIAGLGFLFLSAWMGAVTVPRSMMFEALRITDVKFDPGYLEFTVRNDVGGCPTLVTSVSANQSIMVETPYVINGHNMTREAILPGIIVARNEPIDRDEQVSIIVRCEWTPRSTYQIGVKGSNNWFFLKVFAPAPLENPFNHPFWHRPSFAYEYW